MWPALLLGLLGVAALVALAGPVGRRLGAPSSPRPGSRTGVAALKGATAVVVRALEGDPPSGRVEVHGLDWAARALQGEPIPVGARVEIIDVQGVTLIVDPEPGSAPAQKTTGHPEGGSP